MTKLCYNLLQGLGGRERGVRRKAGMRQVAYVTGVWQRDVLLGGMSWQGHSSPL